MAYSNDQTQIKSGLSNYIGALLKSSPWEDKATINNVNFILTEQILKLCENENKDIDLYLYEPVLKSLITFFNQRINQLTKVAPNLSKTQIENYKNIIITIQELLKNIN